MIRTSIEHIHCLEILVSATSVMVNQTLNRLTIKEKYCASVLPILKEMYDVKRNVSDRSK